MFTVVSPHDAWLRLEPYLSPIGRVETIATSDSMGRVVAQDMIAPADLPFFARSTMDGYAVRAEDTYGASESQPAYLTVAGEVMMGESVKTQLSAGEALTIHTGGMLPGGADAVVMIENTRQVDASTIEVVRPVARGENVLQIGDDVAQGGTLLSGGSLIRPQDIGGLLALGMTQVAVFQRVVVAIISTGDELVPPEDEPKPGQIRNTNAYTLASLAVRVGATTMFLGIVRDDRQALKEAAERGLEEADLVVISAGSSVSTRDMTADVIGSLGEPGILVHGVSVKPGKPTIIASVGGKPFFGLPGNPGSAMITFELFVTPCIYRLSGRRDLPRPYDLKARLTRNIPSATGREDYVAVRLEEKDGELYAEPVFGKSNLLFPLMKADGIAQVPLDRSGLAAGDVVLVRTF